MLDQRVIGDFIGGVAYVIAGGFFSLVFVLLVERWRKPHLSFQIEPLAPYHMGRKFLRVLVHNKPINRLLGVFTTRQPALMCRAYVTFMQEDNTPVFADGRRMAARWSNTPEPVVRQLGNDSQGNPCVINMRDPMRATNFVDIPAGETEPLDVVMRQPGDTTCYGRNNAVIENPQPPPEDWFPLPKGRYHALVRVQTGGEDFRRVFRVVDVLDDIREFRLEDLEPQPNLAEGLS